MVFLKKWIIIISVIVVVTVGYIIASIFVGMDDKKVAKERAVQIATNEGGLTTVDDFYLYHGKEVYSVVVGNDENGTKQVLWIPKDTKNNSVIKKKYSTGVSKTEITKVVNDTYHPKEIISVKLGMENKVPIWEVTHKDEKGHLQYNYFNFLTGESVTKYIGI